MIEVCHPYYDAAYYLYLAYRKAKESVDLSTQNGAVLVPATREGQIITACNTLPTNIKNTPERLERPLKYNFVEHAERGVIFAAAREGVCTKDSTMYVPWFACSDCARAIILAGVKRVVGHKAMMDKTPERWKESIEHAFVMLKEAGIDTHLYEGEVLPPVKFNGEFWRP